MYLMFFDSETSGLDVNEDEILELGYAIYHIDNPAPVVMKNKFITNHKKEITAEIAEITGITQAIIDKHGEPGEEVYADLISDLKKFDIKYMIGHNAYRFDKNILKNNMARHGLTLPEVIVADTQTDIKYKTKSKSMRLSYLLADHGYINPFPHRALTDALSCAILVYQYDIQKFLEVAATPMIEIRADVGYNNKDLAKALGYGWDGERKIWIKTIRKYHQKEEVEKASFPVLELQRVG